MNSLSLVIRLLAVSVLAGLAVVDVKNRRLPNLAVAVIGTLFFVDAANLRMPVNVVLVHLVVGFVVLGAGLILFAMRLLGGGDAKLAAAIFLWAGSALALPAITVVSVVGTLVSMVSLATYKMDAAAHRGVPHALALFSGARGVPYGVALAVGGSVVILAPALVPLLLAH